MSADRWLEAFDVDDFEDPSREALDLAVLRVLERVDAAEATPVVGPWDRGVRRASDRFAGVGALVALALGVLLVGLVQPRSSGDLGAIVEVDPQGDPRSVALSAPTTTTVPPRAPLEVPGGSETVRVPDPPAGTVDPDVAGSVEGPPTLPDAPADRLRLREGADLIRQGSVATLRAGLVDVTHDPGTTDPVRVRLEGLGVDVVPVGTVFTVGVVGPVGLVAVRQGRVELVGVRDGQRQVPEGEAVMVLRADAGPARVESVGALGLDGVWEAADAAGADAAEVVRRVSRLWDEEER